MNNQVFKRIPKLVGTQPRPFLDQRTSTPPQYNQGYLTEFHQQNITVDQTFLLSQQRQDVFDQSAVLDNQQVHLQDVCHSSVFDHQQLHQHDICHSSVFDKQSTVTDHRQVERQDFGNSSVFEQPAVFVNPQLTENERLEDIEPTIQTEGVLDINAVIREAVDAQPVLSDNMVQQNASPHPSTPRRQPVGGKVVSKGNCMLVPGGLSEERESESSAAQSDQGEQVDSPVKARESNGSKKKHKKHKKQKRRRRSTSSSSSSEDNSDYTSVSNVSRKKKRGGKILELETYSERADESTTTSKAYRKSSPNDEEGKVDSHRPKSNRTSMAPPAAVHKVQKRASRPAAEHQRLPESSSSAVSVDRINSKVMRDVLKRKSSVATLSPEADGRSCKSRASIASGRSSRYVKNGDWSLSVEDIEQKLPADLKNNALAEKTLNVIIRSLSGLPANKRRQALLNELPYIGFKTVRSISNDVKLKLDIGRYLYCANCEIHGTDYNAMKKNDEVRKRSLVHALGPWCKTEENCLDMVFRNCLKKLSREGQSSEDKRGPMTVRNPVLLCGRYLELRLLDLMREHYLRELNEDMIAFLSNSYVDPDSKLNKMFADCLCERYVRRLRDRYNLTVNNYTRLMEDTIGTPDKMFVWTSKEDQADTNIEIMKFVSTAYHDVEEIVLSDTTTATMNNNNNSSSGGSGSSDNSRCSTQREKDLMKKFTMELRSRTEPTIREYEEFLSEIVKASELMLWMCFGLTTTDPLSGVLNMGISYFSVRQEEGKGDIDAISSHVCWNFPLASKFRIDETAVTEKPLVQCDEFFLGVNQMIWNKS